MRTATKGLIWGAAAIGCWGFITHTPLSTPTVSPPRVTAVVPGTTTTLPASTSTTWVLDLALTEGMSGPSVTKVQQALKDLGYRIIVDGDFGPKTREVVKKFQKEHGLYMDGIVGPETLAALGLTTLP